MKNSDPSPIQPMGWPIPCPSLWKTIPERGVVRSIEPFKFWWEPTISWFTADRLRYCKLRWTVSVVNWWRSSVTSLSHWPSTYYVYSTLGLRHRVARVCQRQRRLVKHLGAPIVFGMGKGRHFTCGAQTDTDVYQHMHDALLPNGCVQGHVTSLNFGN